jgi:hypothetical protein
MHLHAPNPSIASDSPKLGRTSRLLWIVIVGVALIRGMLVHWQRHRGIYDIYALAAHNWLAGKNLYAPRDSLIAFRYAPLVAAFLSPVALLPEALGSVLIRGVNVAVFLFGAFAFLDHVVGARRGSRAESIYWLILAPLAFSGLTDLQVNALTTGLMILAIAALPQSRWNFAAICLTGAVLLKAYPIALMTLIILLWPRQMSWRCAVAMFAGLAAPFLLQKPSFVWDQYGRWFHLMSVNNRQNYSMDQWYRDIRLPLGRLGIHVSPHAYLIAQLAAAVWVALVVFTRCRADNNNWRLRLGILYGMTAGWMLAFGPATEGVTYIMLAPALTWLVVEALSQPHGRPWRFAAVALAGSFAAVELSLWFPFGRTLRNLGPQPVAAVILMLALTFLKSNRSVEDDPLPFRAAETKMNPSYQGQ